jgi:hypothetical protein
LGQFAQARTSGRGIPQNRPIMVNKALLRIGYQFLNRAVHPVAGSGMKN